MRPVYKSPPHEGVRLEPGRELELAPPGQAPRPCRVIKQHGPKVRIRLTDTNVITWVPAGHLRRRPR